MLNAKYNANDVQNDAVLLCPESNDKNESLLRQIWWQIPVAPVIVKMEVKGI